MRESVSVWNDLHHRVNHFWKVQKIHVGIKESFALDIEAENVAEALREPHAATGADSTGAWDPITEGWKSWQDSEKCLKSASYKLWESCYYLQLELIIDQNETNVDSVGWSGASQKAFGAAWS